MISLVNGPPYPVMGLAEWKTLARAGRAPEKVTLRKAAGGEPVAPAEDRTVRFTISTGSVDRDRDTIDPEGWDLRNWMRNPVVMWAHDYASLPVARGTGAFVQSGRLLATAEFTPPEVYEFGYRVFEMLRQGFLGATSVGFSPVTWRDNAHGGTHFEAAELLEFSVVPVGANPEALVEAGKKSFDRDGVLKWLNGTAWKAGGEVIRLADPGEFLVDDEAILRGVRQAVGEHLPAVLREAVVPAVRHAIMMVTGRVD